MNKNLATVALSLAVAAAAVSCGDGGNHFFSDQADYELVKADLQERFSGPGDLESFYTLDRASASVGSEVLTDEEIEALDFLYAYMPMGDLTDYSTEFYLDNVRASFKAREEMGWKVPELLFRHFVLPLRVNNENLDSSRVVFYRELKPRVEGKTMEEAILEVNHWCHEKLTYQPSDARTLSPLACVTSTLGRCGEQATFAVAALRSVGIPARQVYTPRWAHTDDNHAWVEAWADGQWHFLGACEPEPVLDLGWFNSPASRGMLMHTKVFGKYDGPEEKVLEGTNYTEINLIDNYAESARVDFKVVDEAGQPVDSALVEFRIYNYAEFYPALSKYTDSEGKTFLSAGKGDMLAWASKDGLYGYSKVSFGTDTEVTIKISSTHSTEPQSLMIVPPPENARIPEVTPEQRAENDARFKKEDEIRKAYMATFRESDGTEKGKLLAGAAGNWKVIDEFLTEHPDSRAMDLLKSLRRKDLKDVTMENLLDSYQAESSVLCPRVENEFLSPYKSFILNNFTEEEKQVLKDPAQLVQWIKANIAVVDQPKTWKVPMSPEGVLTARVADTRSRDIFFVAAARTFGTEARKDPVTGKIQYLSGRDWVDVDFEGSTAAVAPSGKVVLEYSQAGHLKNPNYYTHFTISKIENGRTSLLTFDAGQVDMGSGLSWEGIFKKGTSLEVGDYILVSGNRLSDGSVPVSMQEFTVREGETTTLPLKIVIPEGKLPVIGSFDSEGRYSKTPGSEPVSILSTTGRGIYVIGFLTAGREPSVHAVNDLAAAKKDLEAWGGTILLLTDPDGLEWLEGYSEALPSNVRMGVVDASMYKGHQTPYILIADTFNRVFFESEGYRIGLGDQIVSSLNKL